MAPQNQQPLSFRNPATNVEVGTGDKRKVIVIEDLPYRTHQELLKLLGDMWLERCTVPEAVKRIDFRVQQTMLMDKKSADEAARMLSEGLSALYVQINDARVVQIVKIGTRDQVTDDMLGDMTVSEVAGLAHFILERNFKALKNFFASLDSIQNPSQTQK